MFLNTPKYLFHLVTWKQELNEPHRLTLPPTPPPPTTGSPPPTVTTQGTTQGYQGYVPPHRAGTSHPLHQHVTGTQAAAQSLLQSHCHLRVVNDYADTVSAWPTTVLAPVRKVNDYSSLADSNKFRQEAVMGERAESLEPWSLVRVFKCRLHIKYSAFELKYNIIEDKNCSGNYNIPGKNTYFVQIL